MKLKTTVSVPILLFFVFWLLFISNNIDYSVDTKYAFIVITLVQLFVYIIPSAIFIKFKPKGYLKSLSPSGFKISDIKTVVSASFLTVTCGCLFSVIAFTLKIAEKTDSSVLDAQFKNDPLLSIITLVLLPVLLEEFFFRGIITKEYKKYGGFISIVFSSVCFAMFHFSFEHFTFYFVMGIILGIISMVTESLLCSAAVHFVYNMFAIFGQRYFFNLINNFSNTEFITIVLVILSLLSLFSFLSSLDYHFFELAYSTKLVRDTTSHKNENFFVYLGEVFLSPYFLIPVISFLIVAFQII